jgi:outer membrane murein-binding lipoprotein Lpp
LEYAGVVFRGLIAAAGVALAVLALTGCGSGRKHAAAPSRRCTSPKAIAKLAGDVAALRRAARLPTSDTLRGNEAVNIATDRFLRDVALARIDNKRRNRMIDHAAATLSGACEQCFQALEAARPIPGIRLGVSGC